MKPCAYFGLLLLAACPAQPQAAPDMDWTGTVVQSASGRYRVRVLVRPPGPREPAPSYDFEILGADGASQMTTTRAFAGWFSLWFSWDDSDRLWVRSGDVGLWRWERVGDSWIEQDVEAPQPPPRLHRPQWISKPRP